jgi:hypothetical protein
LKLIRLVRNMYFYKKCVTLFLVYVIPVYTPRLQGLCLEKLRVARMIKKFPDFVESEFLLSHSQEPSVVSSPEAFIYIYIFIYYLTANGF